MVQRGHNDWYGVVYFFVTCLSHRGGKLKHALSCLCELSQGGGGHHCDHASSTRPLHLLGKKH
jgi:hypothetical protein